MSFFLLLLGALCRGDEVIPSPRPWDVCSLTEGKGGGCTIINPPRRFQDFLQPELMANESGRWSELSLILRNHPKTVVEWDELGKLGGHRLRRIEYSLVQTANPEALDKFAGFIVLEGNAGIFAPLFKWYGSPMPRPKLYEAGGTHVLVAARDFGGNVPMVMTWAWVWTVEGPMRIEVRKAVQEAIAKVAPGHTGYDTGIDWSNLCTETYSWGPQGYPGKVGVDEKVNAWFELHGNRLVVKRVQWIKSFDKTVPVRRWP